MKLFLAKAACLVAYLYTLSMRFGQIATLSILLWSPKDAPLTSGINCLHLPIKYLCLHLPEPCSRCILTLIIHIGDKKEDVIAAIGYPESISIEGSDYCVVYYYRYLHIRMHFNSEDKVEAWSFEP